MTFVQSLRSSSPFPRALAVLLAAGSLSLGCADTEETLDEESAVDDLTTDTKAIAPGSFQEEAVLLVAGDRALTDVDFQTKVKITATATKSKSSVVAPATRSPRAASCPTRTSMATTR